MAGVTVVVWKTVIWVVLLRVMVGVPSEDGQVVTVVVEVTGTKTVDGIHVAEALVARSKYSIKPYIIPKARRK